MLFYYTFPDCLRISKIICDFHNAVVIDFRISVDTCLGIQIQFNIGYSQFENFKSL